MKLRTVGVVELFQRKCCRADRRAEGLDPEEYLHLRAGRGAESLRRGRAGGAMHIGLNTKPLEVSSPRAEIFDLLILGCLL